MDDLQKLCVMAQQRMDQLKALARELIEDMQSAEFTALCAALERRSRQVAIGATKERTHLVALLAFIGLDHVMKSLEDET